QIARVRGGRMARVASVPLGAVRTTLRFLRHDPPRAREIQALRRESRERLLGVLPRARAGDALIGLGGSLRALGRIFLRTVEENGASPHWLKLRREEIAQLRARRSRPARARPPAPAASGPRARTPSRGAPWRSRGP